MQKKESSKMTDIQEEIRLLREKNTCLENNLAELEAKFLQQTLATENLLERETNFRNLFDTMILGVVFQTAKGEIISANPAAVNLLGLSLDQLKGKTSLDPGWKTINEDFSDLPGEQHPVMLSLRDGIKVGPKIIGVFHPLKNCHVWIRVSATPLFRPGESKPYQAYALIENISEKRQAELNYQLLFREMLDGFALHEMIYNDRGEPVDYRFLAVNPAFERITGLHTIDLINKTVLEILPNTEFHWIETYSKVVLSGEPVFFENYSVEMDKHFEVTAFRPAPGQFACIFNDVTWRKKAEEVLEQERTLIDGFFNSIPGLIFLYDEEGRLVRWNKRHESITGFSADELIHRTIKDWFEGDPESLAAVNAAVEITFQKGFSEVEAKLRTKDGSLLPMFFTASSLLMGGKRYLAGIGIDISERKALEEQLLQSRKLESVGRLAGGVAHDFNNMLGVILGHAEIALESLSSSHPLYTDLIEIKKAAEKSASLTRQLLGFARKQSVAPVVINVNASVEGMLKMLNRLIGENTELAWKPAADAWAIKIDPSQMDQLLTNLCVNARDAISGAGKITIKTSNFNFSEDFCLSNLEFRPGSFLCLTVSDSGSGMEKEVLNHIFEPFFTTKPDGKGTGLGLATVYGIIKQNNGFIKVTSEPGKGTTFAIYLPRHTGETQVSVPHSTKKIPVGNGEVILIVEDELSILNLAAKILEELGYKTLTACKADEAIKLATENADSIKLLLSDVIIPGLNGMQIAEEMKKIIPEISVLFMSGYTDNLLNQQGMPVNTSLLAKPFTMRELGNKVYEALSKKADIPFL